MANYKNSKIALMRRFVMKANSCHYLTLGLHMDTRPIET